MFCPRCDNVKMKDIKRKGGFHKQTKFTCPECGLTKMKSNYKTRKSKSSKFDY